MGRDYSYVLRFRRSQLKEILLAVVERSNSGSMPPVEVILPGGEESIFLPFYVLPNQIRPASFDHRFPPFFGMSLWFEPDAPFERYAAAQAAGGYSLPRDAQGRVSFGSIYLTLHMKPALDNPDMEFLDFSFTPATRQMSMLFAASESLRRFFIQLLEEHNGFGGSLRTPAVTGDLLLFGRRQTQTLTQLTCWTCTIASRLIFPTTASH